MAHDDDADALDRAAILARRQRFIALALSGLAVSCGDDATSPMPCLDVAPQTESSTVTGPTEGDTTASGSSTGSQMPCLGALPETSSSDTSGASASTSSSGTDSGASTGTVDSTGGDDSTGTASESTGEPMPCLSPMG